MVSYRENDKVLDTRARLTVEYRPKANMVMIFAPQILVGLGAYVYVTGGRGITQTQQALQSP